MSLASFGDLTQSFFLRQQGTTLKSDLQRLSTEMTTGQVTDVAARLSGYLGPLLGIDSTLARLQAHASVTTEAALHTEVMQTALERVDTLSSDASKMLIAAASTPSTVQMDAVAAEARGQFATAVSTLNTQLGDRSLFAGVLTGGPALIDANAMLTAIVAATAGAISAADVKTAVAAWFADPAGFEAVAYQGGSALAPWSIAEGETAGADFTANDPAVRDTLKGLAMAAIMDLGVLAGQPEARRDLGERAGISLLNSETGRIALSARLGSVQAQIEDASIRNAAEVSSLQIARSGFVAADPYETAAKLEETQTRLETIYALTARLSRLSLVDFLR